MFRWCTAAEPLHSVRTRAVTRSRASRSRSARVCAPAHSTHRRAPPASAESTDWWQPCWHRYTASPRSRRSASVPPKHPNTALRNRLSASSNSCLSWWWWPPCSSSNSHRSNQPCWRSRCRCSRNGHCRCRAWRCAGTSPGARRCAVVRSPHWSACGRSAYPESQPADSRIRKLGWAAAARYGPSSHTVPESWLRADRRRPR